MSELAVKPLAAKNPTDIKTPGFGYVLISIPPIVSTIKTKSGVEFHISDTVAKQDKFANIFGTVIALPERLKTKTMQADRDKRNFISKDNENRLQVGDRVYFHYLSISNAKKSYDRGTYFEQDGKRYALLPYSGLFFAVRNQGVVLIDNAALGMSEKEMIELYQQTGVIQYKAVDENSPCVKFLEQYIMLNDWLLIEPISKQQHTENIKKFGNIIIDDTYKSESGLVLTTDNPFKSSEGVVRACPPDCGIKVGETIIFEKESDVPVEYDLNRTLDKPYWRMRLEDIVAKRKGAGIELMKGYTLILPDPPAVQSEFDLFPTPTYTGTVVKVAPEINKEIVGETVLYQKGLYCDFPINNEQNGILVKESAIWLVTNGCKVEINW